MKRIATAAAALALTTTGALAAGIDDLPAGNEWDKEIVVQYFPALADEAVFQAVDTDGNEMISRNELQAAMESGDL